jgi:hypothetical protein
MATCILCLCVCVCLCFVCCFWPAVGSGAVALTGELLRIFALEALHRARQRADDLGDAAVEMTHLEQILPQLLLDF